MPPKARGLLGKCVALCADATLDADEEVRLRADALAILLPRLLLYPTGAAWRLTLPGWRLRPTSHPPYEAVTFGTFGSFGTGTWDVISKACDPSTHPKARDDLNPWNAPGPRRDFILSLGFALQRANSRMLRDADRRRRKARSCGIYSSCTRPSSLSSDDDY